MISKALVRGSGIRDVSEIFGVSISKTLSILTKSSYNIKPQKTHYGCLEVDELWTFVGSKQDRHWLIYAYDRETGEIVAWVWGNRDTNTAKKLRKKLTELGVTYDSVATDDWQSFINAFKGVVHFIGKNYTEGIEGNNCRLRHRMRRLFRKTCNFSKKLFNHLKAFEMTINYINFGWV